MRPSPVRHLALGVVVLLSHAADGQGAPVTDRPPDQGGYTRAMGIPSLFRVTTGVEFLAYQPAENLEIGGLLDISVMRYIGNPVVGLAGLALEGYAGGSAEGEDFGGRAYLAIPSLMLGAGVDYRWESEATDFILKLDVPVRREGIVGAGSAMTLRWLPTRGQTFSLGLTVPIGDPNAGVTRPQRDHVEMDDRRPARLEWKMLTGVDTTLARSLGDLRERARWLAHLTQPFAEHAGADAEKAMAPRIAELRAHMASTSPAFPNGHTLNEEIRVYHETLDRAFSIAVAREPGDIESTPQGRRISAEAKRILLDDVIFPYNYLFGQLKEKDILSGMTAVAHTNFIRWLLSNEEVGRDQARATYFVFQSLCDIVEENRAELRERWGDNRYVWLPLQYGLTPEEHDTQREMDRIIERATRADFTAGNRVWYILNEEFQIEMARSVRQAQDYHVLWIHDMSGVNGRGEPDAITYGQVRNYLLALTERVRAYDRVGKFPTYIILLDQVFFEANESRLWMRLLEDPLRHAIELPKAFDGWEKELRRLQEDLRRAVNESVGMQIERTQFGEKWLHNRVRVQVNITNPADYSFYSMRIVGRFPVPDNHMRDHRKIIFYDVTEDDPYRGMAIFTGMGIGEHYTGSTWEDRALMLQGPAALVTKDAARSLLEVQGFDEDEIPYPLRSRPKAPSYERAVADEIASSPRRLAPSRVMQLHNETGFAPKPLNVAKAVLYSLMPSGSVIKVPDSLWQSYVYASLIAGSALRGCRSIVIAPSLAAAPSAGAPQMARANGLMKRLVVFGATMDDFMIREGGILKVGLYTPRQGVGDIAGRLQQAVDRREAWMSRVYHFSPRVDSVAMNASRLLDEIGYRPIYLTEKDSLESPKLHLKANLFASSSVWDDLLSRPEWADVVTEYIRYIARMPGPMHQDGENPPDVRDIPEALSRQVAVLAQNYFTSLTKDKQETMMSYFTIGSANMDYRSQVLNGEVMTTIGGPQGLIGVLDFVLLTGLCVWPETAQGVDELLPPPGRFTRRFADLIKVGL